MRKQDLIQNPLFNQLLEKAQRYQTLNSSLNEQEAAGAEKKPADPAKPETAAKPGDSTAKKEETTKTSTAPAEKKISDLEKILSEIIFGAYAIMTSTVVSFPAGKFKDEFSSKFNAALQGLKSDSAPKSVMDKISNAFTDFLAGAIKDPGGKGFEQAFKNYELSMDLYKQALDELKKQDPDKFDSESTKKFLGDKIASILDETIKILSSNKGEVKESLFIIESLESKRAERFSKKGNMVSFINNCKTMISQIQSKIDQAATYSSASPELKTPGQYEEKFKQLLNRANELMNDAKTTRKEDGRKIKDDDLISKYNDLYTEIKSELEESSSNFDSKIKDERINYLKSLKYSKVAEILSKAVELKNKGDEERGAATEEILKAAEASKKEGEGEKKETKSEIDLKKPIKRSESGGKKNPDVEAFQKLILNKFKNVKAVTETDIWKKFSKYGADGLFGSSTAGIIQGLKAGFDLKDSSSDITAELVNKIETEKLTESKSPVLTFRDFERLNKGILEAFNGDAFKKTVESGGSRGKTEEVNKGEVKSAAKESGTDKKISSDDIKKAVEDAVNKVKGDFNREKKVQELVKIKGVKKNEGYNGGTNMAIATCPGLRFYENGVALRLWDKVMGYYDTENDSFKGNDGSTDKLSVLASKITPDKYAKKITALYRDIYGSSFRDKKLYNELLKWKPEEIKLLASGYKSFLNSKGKSSNLFDDLSDEWTNTEEIKKVIKKFSQSL